MRLIAINPTLRAEAERLAPALAQAQVPATAQEVMEILIRHAPHYGVTAKSDAEWGWYFDPYMPVLRGLSVQAIEEGFVRWNRGEGHGDLRMAGFFPKAPQLFLLAEKSRRDLIMAAYRAKKALEYVERPAKPEVTPEDRKAIAEQFRRLSAELGTRGAKTMPEMPRPTRSPHAVAEQLRAAAAEVGDVI